MGIHCHLWLGERHVCGCALGRLFWHVVGDELRRPIWGLFAVDQVNGGVGDPVIAQRDDCYGHEVRRQASQRAQSFLDRNWENGGGVHKRKIFRWEINLGWKRFIQILLPGSIFPSVVYIQWNLIRWVRYKLDHAVLPFMALPECSHELISTALWWSGFHSWYKIGDFCSIF